MGWSSVWPVERWDVPDDEAVFGELRSALDERDDLVPGGYMPDEYDRLDAIEGVPPTGQAVGAMQQEIAATLTAANSWRWWDATRSQLLTLANLLTDTISQDDWSVDLTETASRWAAPAPDIFNELRDAINGLTTVRRLPASAISSRVDSVYDLTFGITNWATDRAAVLAEFDGTDDGVDTGLVYDVGLSAEVFDSGSDQQWYLDARTVAITFDTSALSGLTVSAARLEFDTAAPGGSTDFSDTFTAQVVAPGDQVRGSFASNDYSLKSITLSPGDLNTSGNTVITLRSSRANSADRTAWSPSGPDYSSTYREGFDLGTVLRLVVEVTFEYSA